MVLCMCEDEVSGWKEDWRKKDFESLSANFPEFIIVFNPLINNLTTVTTILFNKRKQILSSIRRVDVLC